MFLYSAGKLTITFERCKVSGQSFHIFSPSTTNLRLICFSLYFNKALISKRRCSVTSTMALVLYAVLVVLCVTPPWCCFFRLIGEKEEKILELESSMARIGEESVDKEQLLQNMQSDKTALSRSMAQNKELKHQLAELQNGFVKMVSSSTDLSNCSLGISQI